LGKKRICIYFLRDIIDPPSTDSIPSINPAIGIPVCCIGISVVVVLAFTVVELVGVN
jgi:hypothetical protein